MSLKIKQPSSIPVGAAEIETSFLYEGRMAPAGMTFLIIRVYTSTSRKQKNGKMKRDRYAGHVLVKTEEIESDKRKQQLADHVFNSLCDKYKLQMVV